MCSLSHCDFAQNYTPLSALGSKLPPEWIIPWEASGSAMAAFPDLVLMLVGIVAQLRGHQVEEGCSIILRMITLILEQPERKIKLGSSYDVSSSVDRSNQSCSSSSFSRVHPFWARGEMVATCSRNHQNIHPPVMRCAAVTTMTTMAIRYGWLFYSFLCPCIINWRLVRFSVSLHCCIRA